LGITATDENYIYEDINGRLNPGMLATILFRDLSSCLLAMNLKIKI
jgi:hypothetical protein